MTRRHPHLKIDIAEQRSDGPSARAFPPPPADLIAWSHAQETHASGFFNDLLARLHDSLALVIGEAVV
jgi:hypothetical protein